MVRAQRTYETHRRIRKEQIRIKKKTIAKRLQSDGDNDASNNNNKRAALNRALLLKKQFRDANPQLELLLKNAPHYERSLPLPYELLMKIFHYLIQISDHPIKDLCSLAHVCETWRIIVVNSPTLWSRIDFRELPITDGNFRILSELVNLSPAILQHVQEVSVRGQVKFKDVKSAAFLDSLITAPNLQRLIIDSLEHPSRQNMNGQITRAISQCRNLKNLTIKNTRCLLGHQKWLADHLVENGKHLEELHLTSSLTSVSSQLFRAIASDYCPQLRVLDISTCDFLNTRSFDAILMAQNMPNLIILRLANVSFRRVHEAPQIKGLTNLEELSMPIGMRDADRDDALYATFAYGSYKLTTLDLRGSSISAHALEDTPSGIIRELHIDDICPLTRAFYCNFIRRWRDSLEVLSLVKINCSETIKSCLRALLSDSNITNIREIDLESSNVAEEDLKKFLDSAKSLQTINLTSCRSLPRGCKGRYSQIESSNAQPLIDLKRRLGTSHSDSDTEIDEENAYTSRTGRKRRKVRRPNYLEADYTDG